MKATHRIAATIAGAALFVLTQTACTKSTVTGEGGEKLSIYEPAAVVLRRGGTARVDLKIRRNALSGDVSVAFANLPSGVDVVDSGSRIAGDAGAYTLRASDTADLVEKSAARVTATGPDGIAVTTSVTVSVREKDGR